VPVFRVFGPQHTLLGGQNFAIHLLGFREAALRLMANARLPIAKSSG
jgi:hypothetical protein